MIWGPTTKTKESAEFLAARFWRELREEKKRRSHILYAEPHQLVRSTYKIWDQHLAENGASSPAKSEQLATEKDRPSAFSMSSR